MRLWSVMVGVICSLMYMTVYADQNLVEQGRKVYLQCVKCHGPDGKTGLGKPLADQTREELIRKIRAYRAGQIMGSTNAALMTFKARSLSDADIEAVTAYIEARLIKRH